MEWLFRGAKDVVLFSMEESNRADIGMHGSTTHASPDAEIARDFHPVSQDVRVT
jgi:hypothetical protein